MKGLISVKNLEELSALCEDPQEAEEIKVYSAVSFATKYTCSTTGFISTIDLENERSLSARELYIVTSSQRVWRYNGRISLPIGGEELLRNERSLSGYVAYTRKPYRCPNVHCDPYYVSINDNVCSELGVPIIQRNRLLGVINLESHRANHYKQHHEEFLVRVAKIISNSLEIILERQEFNLIPRFVSTNFSKMCNINYSTSQDFLAAVLHCIGKRIEISKGYARIKDGRALVFRACFPSNRFDHERLLFHHGLYLPIGTETLPEDNRSFAGYISMTQKSQRVQDLSSFSWYKISDKDLKSALGAPIVYTNNLLGVITLMHYEKAYYTTWHEKYLSAFIQQIAVPLYGLLTKESYRTPQKAVRMKIKNSLLNMGTDDPFSTYEVTHIIAEQIAKALRSRLCTIWLADSKGELAWQGVWGLTPSSSVQISQAIYDVARIWPHAFCPAKVAHRETFAWDSFTNQETWNCGPNRDPTFLSMGYAQPFLVMPLLSYENRALGVIHVGMKETTLENPYGFYSEADEQLLEILQLELLALYERRQLRCTAEYTVEDLHDALGLFTAEVLYGIDSARTELLLQDYLGLESILDDIERNTQSIVREIRCIMFALKSHAWEEMDVVQSLKNFIEHSVKRPGMEVEFIAEGQTPRLPIKLEWQLYRIAQEAFTNTIKHAKATHVKCTIVIRQAYVMVTIQDNGIGFSKPALQYTGHNGLANMQRRAKTLGGVLDVFSVPGKGTLIRMVIPR